MPEAPSWGYVGRLRAQHSYLGNVGPALARGEHEALLVIAGYYYEAGHQDFDSWSKTMSQDVGEWCTRHLVGVRAALAQEARRRAWRMLSAIGLGEEERVLISRSLSDFDHLALAENAHGPAASSQSPQGRAPSPTTETQGDELISAAQSRPTDRRLAEMGRLIGLREVKTEFNRIVNFIEFQQSRKKRGLKDAEISLHMVFEGNPGTGKTIVARIVAEVYKELGVLSRGHLVETDRSGLVGGYLGQTAIKAREVAEHALGGVLFIDEAYTLTPKASYDDAYGREALDTLMKFMEDHRGDLAMIVAGYPDDMERFLSGNPGVKSRFCNVLRFDDYTPQELVRIFEFFCNEADYVLSPTAAQRLLSRFELEYASRDPKEFGNARYARSLFDEARKSLANRIHSPSGADTRTLMTINQEDIPPIRLW